MKKLGVLGGLGPQATELFYHQVIEECQAKNHPYPQIIINSVPIFRVIELLDNKDDLVKYLVKEIKKIEGFVDFLAIPCNGMHFVIKELRENLDVPIIAIHEEVGKELKKLKIKKAGILGTKVTTGNNFYAEELKKYGIEYFSVGKENEEELSKIIFDEIIAGKDYKIISKKLKKYIRIVEENGCDALVLACTELPLFITKNDTKIKLVSSTRILARSVLDKIFRN